MLKTCLALLACGVISSWREATTCLLLVRFLFLLNKPVALESAHLNFELDFLGWALIILTFWVVAASVLRSTKVKSRSKSNSLYLTTLIRILAALTLTFSVSRRLVFYILFETCLIPILVVILGWGYQPERARAGLYLLFYTIFGSLPLLVFILRCRSSAGSGYIHLTGFSVTGAISALCLSLAFLVKFPIYGAHLWLLKAHVEAPVAGSMVLAGVLLKLGGFGLIRIFYYLDYNLLPIKELVASIRLWGGVLISLNCLRHIDMKILIASSSVVHIRACVVALFLLSDWSVKGCLLMMVAHGVCSSGLFSLANIVYERTNRRSMVIAKGLLNLTPSMALCWFLMLTTNMAAPPSINLGREIILLSRLVSWNFATIAPLGLLGFFSAAYSLYLFSMTQHGVFNKTKSSLNNTVVLEYLIVVLHWVPLNALILAVIFVFCFNSLIKTLFCGNRDIQLFETLRLKTNRFSLFSAAAAMSAGAAALTATWLAFKEITIIADWEIIVFNGSSATITVIFDWMRLIFLAAVLLITRAISAYSFYYIKEDSNKIRFIILLMLFVASMLCLIVRPNIVRLLLGWDGLGLTSYALVIYYQNESSCNAGMLTVLRNRVGDVCILLAIALLSHAGSWLFFSMDKAGLPLICVFVGLAGMTKRAQVPFSAWLPAAIAAPTPVSALVHSSTLVTAGVYLLIRFYHLLAGSRFLQALLVAAALTTIVAGWGANFEFDLKKIVALSTLSQLGLIIITLSVGIKTVAFFHIISHAMFKSALFIAAGVIIHMSNSSQDSRFIGRLFHRSPFLISSFSVINMSLLGFPFLSGFYSKDLAIELTFSALPNKALLALVLLAAGLTVAYSLRAILMSITSATNLQSSTSLHDRDRVVIARIASVLFTGTRLGYFFSWVVLWTPHAVVLHSLIKYRVLVAMLVRGAAAFLILKVQKKAGFFYSGVPSLVRASRKMWFLPFLSTKHLTLITANLSAASLELLDKGWLEAYPPQKGGVLFSTLSQWTQKRQSTILIRAYLITSLSLLMLLLLIYLHSLIRVL